LNSIHSNAHICGARRYNREGFVQYDVTKSAVAQCVEQVYSTALLVVVGSNEKRKLVAIQMMMRITKTKRR